MPNPPFSRQDRHAHVRRSSWSLALPMRDRICLGDLSTMHNESVLPYVLLGIALLVALGFEFVNGFHDTANAVATVIYTHSLEPHVAVVWSGFWNFLGVMASSGLVAFTIVSLAAGGVDFAGGQQGRICHGLRAAGRRDHLESGNVVLRTASLQFSHADRFGHRRRHRQPNDGRQDWHFGRRLGTSRQHRQVAAALPASSDSASRPFCC